jgi:hypothetical protein
MNLKSIVLAASSSLLLAGAASATTSDLGAAVVGTPLTFAGVAAGPFSDIFTFTLPANGGSGYSVANFELLKPLYDAALTSFALVSNADGVVGSADDAVLASTFSAGTNSLSMTYGASPAGKYYLWVAGITTGSAGGIYNGAISVSAVTTPVPEPETFALMLAGLGTLGFLARRRRGA